MSHPDEGDREHEARTLEQLAEDWITLWQTEIAGWMTDPELARMLAAWMSQGAAGWGGASGGAPGGPMGWPAGWPTAGMAPPHEFGPFAAFFRAQSPHGPPNGPSWGFPPGAASPAPPPPAGGVAGATGAGDGSAALVEVLLRRVAELERRMADLGPDPAGGAAPAARPRRVRVKRR